MAFDSFRDFVNALDRAGELKRISQPVATELEITGIADREMKSPGVPGVAGDGMECAFSRVSVQISPRPYFLIFLLTLFCKHASMASTSRNSVKNQSQFNEKTI